MVSETEPVQNCTPCHVYHIFLELRFFVSFSNDHLYRKEHEHSFTQKCVQKFLNFDTDLSALG